jgi:hypothetical protein
MEDDHDRQFAALIGSTRGYAGGGELAGPLRAVKRAARGASRGAKRGAKIAVRAHPLALTAVAAKFAGKGLAAATGPLRRRIFKAFFGKLTSRRARLVSWSRRRSLQPNTDEQRAARTWAVAYVKRKGLLGRLVGATLSGDVIGEPATTAALTASIPVLLELARRAPRTAEREGAPSDPHAAAEADAASATRDDARV